MNPNVTRAIASACLILMIGLLPVAVRGQDTSGVQDGGKVVALLGVSVGAEQREERIEQEVFVGSPGCGLFEEGTSRLYSLAFDVLMPVDNSGGSGPGFSLQFGLASSSAQVEAPEPYVIRATAAGESNLVELPHSYHLESNSLDVRFDLFWDQYLWRGLRLRAGAGASFALPGSTGEFNRIDHDIYRFEDGERERELPVAGPGFASIRVGPLAGLGYRIDLPSGATLDPAVIVRMNFDPDESRLSGFSIGLRLGLHFPIRRPLDPLAVSLMIGDRDHAGLPSDSVGLQLVVIDGYRSVGGAWEMGRRVEGPILAIAPRWQGAAGGGVAAWSITVRQDGDTLLAAGSDDPAPPQRIDWKIPAEDRIDTVIGLTAELHVRDSLGRAAAMVKRMPLALHHLVLHTAQSRGRALTSSRFRIRPS